MEGHATVSDELLARYAADAAGEVEGVHGLVDGRGRHHGVRIEQGGDGVSAEVHLALDWSAGAATAGTAVQERVAEYLARMADVRIVAVDVVIDEIAPPRG